MPTNSGRARLCSWVIACALALAGSAARADDAPVRSRMRQALLETVPYRSPTETAVKPAVVAQPGSDDPEVVVLPQLDVHSLHPRTERAEARAIERSATFAPADTKKLGTGVRERDFGKVRIGTASVLYIPVNLKISW